MTVSIAAALQTHLNGEVTTLATLWTITRKDGTVHRYTDHDQAIVFGGNTYETGVGFNASAIEDKADLSVDNLDLQGIITGDDITPEAIRAGLFDFAQVQIEIINYAAPANGSVVRRKGWLGEVKRNDVGAFSAELRGLSQALIEQTVKVYTPACQVDLGSTKCGIPVDPAEVQRSTAYAVGDYVKVATDTSSPPLTTYDRFENTIYVCVTAGTTAATTEGSPPIVYDPSITSPPTQTTDGTAVFEPVTAWTRHAEVATPTDKRVFTVTVDEPRADDNTTWFAGGLAVFETGLNAGLSMEIKAWDGTGSPALNQITLFLPMPYTITAGDKIRLVPGCDKLRTTCLNKFANVINFRGFPDLPGDDWMVSYPLA